MWNKYLQKYAKRIEEESIAKTIETKTSDDANRIQNGTNKQYDEKLSEGLFAIFVIVFVCISWKFVISLIVLYYVCKFVWKMME